MYRVTLYELVDVDYVSADSSDEALYIVGMGPYVNDPNYIVDVTEGNPSCSICGYDLGEEEGEEFVQCPNCEGWYHKGCSPYSDIPDTCWQCDKEAK